MAKKMLRDAYGLPYDGIGRFYFIVTHDDLMGGGFDGRGTFAFVGPYDCAGIAMANQDAIDWLRLAPGREVSSVGEVNDSKDLDEATMKIQAWIHADREAAEIEFTSHEVFEAVKAKLKAASRGIKVYD